MAAPAIPPLVHSDDEVRRWFINVLLPKRDVWLAEVAAGEVVGVLVLDSDWVDQLYVDPTWTGRNIGSHLIGVAKQQRPSGLRLWTFESNDGAQRFYERHGFVAEERTDGSHNEEKAPDIRYVWHPGKDQPQ